MSRYVGGLAGGRQAAWGTRDNLSRGKEKKSFQIEFFQLFKTITGKGKVCEGVKTLVKAKLLWGRINIMKTSACEETGNFRPPVHLL